jgi:glycosyltransferase involved in cell wall biosynthesis
MMKVAFVLGTTAGGTLRHVQMLAAGAAVRGVPTVVCGPAGHAPDFRFDQAGAAPVSYETVQFGDRPSIRDGLAVLRLRQVLARHQPDVVHAHGLRAGALAALALTLATRPSRAALPLVVTVHNAPPEGGVNATVYQGLQFLAARGAAVVLCVSGDLEERMRRAGARDVRRALVPPYAPGAPSTPTAATSPDAVREELGAGDRPLILAVGRLAPQKDFGTLIEAARGWQDLDPVPLLAIAGSGPLRDDLAAAAVPLGSSAVLLGQRTDVPSLLAAADVFVLPSRWEGQPLILAEALRAGRPIVATRVGGTPDLTGEDAAVLVPPGDPAALTAAVRQVLGDPALAARLADAAQARARTLPTANAAVESALAIYRVLAGPAQITAAGPDSAGG